MQPSSALNSQLTAEKTGHLHRIEENKNRYILRVPFDSRYFRKLPLENTRFLLIKSRSIIPHCIDSGAIKFSLYGSQER